MDAEGVGVGDRFAQEVDFDTVPPGAEAPRRRRAASEEIDDRIYITASSVGEYAERLTRFGGDTVPRLIH
jgi:hypothetical protein